VGGSNEASLRDLIARLIQSGKAFVEAEIALVLGAVRAWAGAAMIIAALALVAFILVNAAIVVLLAALGMALATWLGMAGGLAVAALIALLVAGLLCWIAFLRVKALVRLSKVK
jgi:high-affinity K+ transport system ATPase subunit B